MFSDDKYAYNHNYRNSYMYDCIYNIAQEPGLFSHRWYLNSRWSIQWRISYGPRLENSQLNNQYMHKLRDNLKWYPLAIAHVRRM